MFNRIFILLLVLTTVTANSQNAPLTSIEGLVQTGPGSLEIPVVVSNFDDIGAVYLNIDYEHSILQLTGAEPHPQMPTFIHNDLDLGTGYHRITMGWYGNSLSLPDGSTIMTLTFAYTEGNTELVFYDNGSSCEYADGNGQVLNDIPTWEYYSNGWICGELGSPGAIFGESEVCQGRHAVSYSVAPMPNASDYLWQVPAEEATIICGEHTNLVLVDWKDNAQSSDIQVSCINPCGLASSISTLNVTVHPKPVVSAGTNAVVPYAAAVMLEGSVSGAGTYSFLWTPEELLIDPTVLTPFTNNLTSTTVFSLLVTDLETGCQASDEVVVYISGGPLTINPTANDDTLCAGSQATLNAYPSGGAGNYSFQWSSNPPGWNSSDETATVSPDTTTIYYLTVNDGYNIVSDSVVVNILQEVTANISGTDTLCGDNDATTLIVDLTGTPPWDFVYTFELQSVFVTDQMTTPYELQTDEPGSYTVPFVKDSRCDGSGLGSSLVAHYPIPPAPVITLVENTLFSNLNWGNQWYRNGEPIEGATGTSYTATENGSYYDIVTRFSCMSDTSNAIQVVITGIPETFESQWEVFPNPSTEWANIRVSSNTAEEGIIELLSLEGRLVKEVPCYLHRGLNEIRIDQKGVTPGIYILRLQTTSRVLTKKLMVRK